jgi:hypothetical protein
MKRFPSVPLRLGSDRLGPFAVGTIDVDRCKLMHTVRVEDENFNGVPTTATELTHILVHAITTYRSEMR